MRAKEENMIVVKIRGLQSFTGKEFNAEPDNVDGLLKSKLIQSNLQVRNQSITNSEDSLDNDVRETQNNSDYNSSTTNSSSRAEPKKFNTIMSQSDLNKFKTVVEGGNVKTFIEHYLSENRNNNVGSEEDVYSLALIRAISKNDLPLTKFLLHETKHSDSILVNIDSTNNSPVCAALTMGNNGILKEISRYFHNHTCKTKFNVSIEACIKKLSIAVSSPESEFYTPKTYIDEFLKPIYSTETIESIIEIVGQDAIDYYYH
jgi:hypothetical protein